MFANRIIQFFVKANNLNTLKVLNLYSRFGALFLLEKVEEHSSFLLDNVVNEDAYILLTDIAKYKNSDNTVIVVANWC